MSVNSGARHTCALTANGVPVCWGSIETEPELTMAPTEEPLTIISSGLHHTCGLKVNGEPVCWGDTNDSLTQEAMNPPAGERFTLIDSSDDYTCALREDGSPVCWGLHKKGQ